GYSFIGTPFIIAGHSDFAAWGFTNVGGDVLDWYYYDEDEENGKYYYDGQLFDYNITIEEIKIKGEESYSLEIKSTIHGVIAPNLEDDDRNLAISWLGLKDYVNELNRSNVFKTLYGLFRATSFEDAKNAIYNWDCPAQNIVYGDIDGNIALWVAGYHPIRPTGVTGRVPINGSDPNNDWLGLVEGPDWPHSINPEQGYLASANQASVGPNYPYYIGSLQTPGYRGRAINWYLHNDDSVTIEDMKTYQKSNLDTSAETFLPFLLKAIQAKSDAISNKPVSWSDAVNLLHLWNDYIMDKEKAAPLIHWFFLVEYLNLTFNDEYKEAGILEEELPRPDVLENFTRYYQNIKWFDNVSTIGIIEDCNDTLLEAFKQALLKIQDEYGEDVSKWKWGDYHKASVAHLAGLEPLSADIRPHDGSIFTLNAAGGEIVRGGPSERAIYDLSNLSNSFSQLPGGQSGNPVSPHYKDLLENYFFEYTYYPMYFFATSELFPEMLKESTLIIRSDK
ncbi:MAG: penicillin acylase family protein, partial [Candidatus Kariarchaeaceae archaeon]